VYPPNDEMTGLSYCKESTGEPREIFSCGSEVLHCIDSPSGMVVGTRHEKAIRVCAGN